MAAAQEVDFSGDSYGNLSPAVVTALSSAKESSTLTNVLPAPITPLEDARRKYMIALVSDFPSAIKPWEMGGLLENPQTHNIVEHQVVEAIKARILAKDAGLSEEICDNITEAVLVHDAERIRERKGFERALAKTKGSVAIQTAMGILYATSFLESFMGRRIADLAKSVVPDSPKGWSDLPRRIIHLADAISDGSQTIDPHIRASLAIFGNGRRQLDTSLRDAAHEKRMKLQPGEYRKLQPRLATEEAEEVTQLIRKNRPESRGILRTSSDLPTYLDRRFDEEVIEFAKRQHLQI